MASLRGMNEELGKTDTSSISSIGELQKVLSDLSKIRGAENIQKFADGINAITEAARKSGGSYLTLDRLASSIKRFNEISSGFKLPSFAKIESLARTLQENFNAENGLKRMADGIKAFKEAAKSVEQLAKGTENVGTATQDMTEYKNAVEELKLQRMKQPSQYVVLTFPRLIRQSFRWECLDGK